MASNRILAELRPGRRILVEGRRFMFVYIRSQANATAASNTAFSSDDVDRARDGRSKYGFRRYLWNVLACTK